ncbi:hypothetical protein HPB49_024338 [Dermacentor silvarum]|uniref:Uncharacterized protein n=1 Tax=Dermacentor silvarum TaxID=543639 RepID=A0ACB8CTZ8_DERSI|nr:hypothetical protein HPB49_024338 [Dermacentor silvarum]
MACVGHQAGHLYAAAATDDPFVMSSITNVVDVLGIWLAVPLADKCGRRPTMACSCALAGLCYLVGAAFYRHSVAIFAALMVGRAVQTIAYNVGCMHAAEVYPTEIRTQALSIRQAFGSLGKFLSSHVVQLCPALNASFGSPATEVDWINHIRSPDRALQHQAVQKAQQVAAELRLPVPTLGGATRPAPAIFGRFLPLSVLGGMSCLSALITLPLPETNGQKLPETLQEAEAMHDVSRPWFSCCTTASTVERKGSVATVSVAATRVSDPRLAPGKEDCTHHRCQLGVDAGHAVLSVTKL